MKKFFEGFEKKAQAGLTAGDQNNKLRMITLDLIHRNMHKVKPATLKNQAVPEGFKAKGKM